MKGNLLVSIDEVVEVMRQGLREEITVRLVYPECPWSHGQLTVYEFYFGAWQIAFFNDAQQLDYVEWATSPDGRTTHFQEWWDAHGKDPIDALEDEEREDLERLLVRVT